MRLISVIAFLVIIPAVLPSQALPQSLPNQLVGGDIKYTSRRGDTLGTIGSRYAIAVSVLREQNRLTAKSRLKEGQQLRIDNRHIVPGYLQDGILINIPQRLLFLPKEGRVVAAYPVGLGRPDWRTKTGPFKVTALRQNPTWFVPESIQEEMAAAGEEVQTEVRPGPDNPLGKYAIYINIPRQLIHATIAPASIYHFQTHGCVRLHPDDAAHLFGAVKVGDSGEFVYQPVLLAKLSDGRIFAEVNRDVYRLAGPPLETLRSLAETYGISDEIDWTKAEMLAGRAEGVAREVGLPRAGFGAVVGLIR
jgi:L,D-transpeptidase ErfK/SrfK